MTAAARATQPATILRNAAGEPPLGIGGLCFRDDQGEMFKPDASYASAGFIGVLELDDGTWLSHPPGFRIDTQAHHSRDAALRTAIARMVRKARRYMRNKDGEGTHWTEGYAGRVIEWALSHKPEKILVHRASATASPVIGHPGTVPTVPNEADAITDAGVTDDGCSEHSGAVNQAILSDPIVAELVAAHALRKQFPAKHTISMTSAMVNGQLKNLGTCACGVVMSHSNYERLDAAIEAHWRRFSYDNMIDGRGIPIKPGDASRIPSAKPKRKTKKSQPGAGGHPAPLASAPRTDDGAEGADASLLRAPLVEAAPIGAASDETPSGEVTASLPGPVAEAGRIGEASASASRSAYELAPADPATDEGASGDTRSHAPPAFLSATDMAGEPAADWSPLLNAALDLAWREPPQVTASLAALLDFGKVYGPDRKVERPVLRWHGGKWKLAPWIISHFPPHKVYIEPFGGAGSVLLQKLWSATEVWNDLEGEVVNLFRVLRSSTEDLARLIYLTPFSREEYHTLYEVSDDPLERARRFVARSFMGQSSKGALRKSGFDSRINPDGFASRLNSLRAMPEEFHAIAERFRNVIIEQRPADAIFAQYDRQDVLFYADPPYLSDRAKHYNHELDENGHVTLLETLRSLAGMVVLSGYRSELYDTALTDWRRVEIDAHADGGIDRTEVLWLNPACAAALDQQMPALFDIAALDAANTPPLDQMTELE